MGVLAAPFFAWGQMSGAGSIPASTESSSGFVAGKDYAVLDKPIATNAKSHQVEVWEFFSYNCPHCKEFEPLLRQWEKKQSSSVVLRRVPVTFLGPNAALLQKLHYALEELQRSDLYPKVFEAIHEQHRPLNKESEVLAWVGQHGIDQAKFEAVFNGFSMQVKMGQAKHWQGDAGLDGVPTLLIGGRYRIDLLSAHGPKRALDVASYLIKESFKADTKANQKKKYRE